MLPSGDVVERFRLIAKRLEECSPTRIVVARSACLARDHAEQLEVILARLILRFWSDAEDGLSELRQVSEVGCLLGHGATVRIGCLAVLARGDQLVTRSDVPLRVVAIAKHKRHRPAQYEQDEERADDEYEFLVELLCHCSLLSAGNPASVRYCAAASLERFSQVGQSGRHFITCGTSPLSSSVASCLNGSSSESSAFFTNPDFVSWILQ